MLWIALATALSVSQADAVVARVGGEPITVGDVSARAKASGLPPMAALENVIQETVCAQAALADGFAARSDVRAQLEAERRRLAVQHLLEVLVYPTIVATDAEIEAAFHARADQVRLSMVVRATPGEALAALQRLQHGGSLLDEAKQSSDPVIQAKSGILGWVARGALVPELARLAFEAPLLTPVGPIEVPKGFAVAVVHERHFGEDAALARDEPSLRRIVELSKRDDAAERFVSELRRKRQAKVDREFLARTGDRAEASREELDHPVATAGTVSVRYDEIAAPMTVAVGDTSHGASGRAPLEMKERLAWQLLDQRLLVDEALARRMDRGPELARALHVIERAVLADAYAWTAGQGEAGGDDVSGSPCRDRARQAIKARIATLRREARVQLDEAVLPSLLGRH